MAREGDKGEEKGFRVEDRRRVSPEAQEAQPESDKTDPLTGPAEPGPSEGKTSGEVLPEINFSTFVISLSTQALMHLGEIPNPLTGKMESDVPVAKQMIDIIVMLGEKTRGNLDQGEAKLMEEVLYDLRMRYVDAVKKR